MSQETHQVINQVPPLENYNLFLSDTVLVEGVSNHGATWAVSTLAEFGERCGSAEVLQWGDDANRVLPELLNFDRVGNRIDQVRFHPSWHNLLTLSKQAGLHSGPWTNPRAGAHVARSAMYVIAGQVEAGQLCPITMTFASIPVLEQQPEVYDVWAARILAEAHDARYLPAAEKTGLLIGMAMTEKQGGSDVRANTSVARPVSDSGPGKPYLLTGHKWFCSAPQCDAFLVLAQAPGGLSCFLLPRHRPDGSKNSFAVHRLKNKLGNRSNASSELEFSDCWAQLIGEEGRGVKTIMNMVNHTRLDCVAGSAALMRANVVQAIWHCQHRSAFGRRLIEQPLMQNVLADLALESEAATTLALRLSRAYDNLGDARERLFSRIGTAISKYWVCKRAPGHAFEAMECHGGNGYVEESPMTRLYREAPVNSIWEGSGNVNCLDVLRALHRTPDTAQSLIDEISTAAGGHAALDETVLGVKERLAKTPDETQARQLVESLVLSLQASLLIRYSPNQVSDTFCETRLRGHWGRAYGTLPAGSPLHALVDRACPKFEVA